MNKKDAVKKIWRESFDDSEQYVDMFFSRIYRDDDAMLLVDNGIPSSSLLLQRYAMNFHGVTVSIGYVCGAATIKDARCHGLMHRLMSDALRESYRRGDVLCSLIPANEWLFHYYGHQGFSPVFYVDVERYTSMHTFRHSGKYFRFEDIDSDDAYDFFNTMMRQRPCCVQHSREQYDWILMDNSIDSGTVLGIVDGMDNIAALAFVVSHDGIALVKDVLAVDNDARDAILEEIHNLYADMPVTVLGYYTPGREELVARGMARIVNAFRCLEIIASVYPRLKLVMRLCDSIVPENSHVYRIHDGLCEIDDDYEGQCDFDIDIEVLTSIIFGNDVTRRLLDFPATRPFISLMLD
jgi:hypothetical protein